MAFVAKPLCVFVGMINYPENVEENSFKIVNLPPILNFRSKNKIFQPEITYSWSDNSCDMRSTLCIERCNNIKFFGARLLVFSCLSVMDCNEHNLGSRLAITLSYLAHKQQLLQLSGFIWYIYFKKIAIVSFISVLSPTKTTKTASSQGNELSIIDIIYNVIKEGSHIKDHVL